MSSTVTRIGSSEFVNPIEDADTDESGFNIVCEPGLAMERGGYSDSIGAVDEQGHLRVPEGSGLDGDCDWEYIELNATGNRNVYE